jgi:hypothetical protein
MWLLGIEPKNGFFYHMTSDFNGFWFFTAYRVFGKQTKKIKLGQNLKLVVVAFGPICMPTMCFNKILSFGSFMNVKNL